MPPCSLKAFLPSQFCSSRDALPHYFWEASLACNVGCCPLIRVFEMPDLLPDLPCWEADVNGLLCLLWWVEHSLYRAQILHQQVIQLLALDVSHYVDFQVAGVQLGLQGLPHAIEGERFDLLWAGIP